MVKKQIKMESDKSLTSSAAKDIKSRNDGGKKWKMSHRRSSFIDPRLLRGRGVVYLSHIPHGFYEREMRNFFAQFGHVTRLRLVRSDKTGNSKGYAFIEFMFKEVAQVVAETMNNYLMQNRLLKAVFIPHDKIKPGMFSHCHKYGPETCIGAKNRRTFIENQNKVLSEKDLEIRCNRQKDHFIKLQEKLKAQGVDCIFQVEGSSSKRLRGESDHSQDHDKSKKMKTLSQDEINLKPSKQATAVSALKTQSIANKSQVPQKSLKKIKVEKSMANKSSKQEKPLDKSSRQATVKNDKKKKFKKSVEKLPSVKKVVKRKAAVKSSPIRKEMSKKNILKKQLGKK